MCASRSRPYTYAGAPPRSNHDRNPQPAPYHPFYPIAYPRWPAPCDPYAAYHCHPGAFYPTPSPYCGHHEVIAKEDAAVSWWWWSWLTVLLLVLLVTGLWIGIAYYRKLSHETRRKIAAWLARFSPQVIAPVDSAVSAASRSRGSLIRPDRERERTNAVA